ncbi:MAG: glycosyltransferase [Archaeoglobaceae archaeon]|nr:glycosyltransferase [Archaeoglobaceae archaeon]MCX8151874.1 glycosyltransferase [Archaeoglobaceae archaeon]MDW8014294.1 glycosyltransferase family 2 protein [Archaeoglobaceae archaeon]
MSKFLVNCSVIISTYTTKRCKDLVRCLKSIKRQSIQPDEVIVVLDPSEKLLRFYSKRLKRFNVKIILSQGFGLSNARNTGIEVSKGEILVFIDDDAYAKRNWLEKLLKNFEDEKVWVVGGKVVPKFKMSRPKWFPKELDWIVGCSYKGMSESREVRNPLGANMAFKRSVFKEVGLFRTEIGRFGKLLLGSEETELCIRLKKKFPDIKIVYEPSAVVYHKVSKERLSFTYVLKRAYYEGVSKAVISNGFKLGNEKFYLKFLVKSIFSYFSKLKIRKVFIIILVICSTLTGFSLHKIRKSFQVKKYFYQSESKSS